MYFLQGDKMKYVLCAFIALFSVASQASIKLQAQGNWYEADNVKPLVGLSVYEPVTRWASINSWVGYGNVPNEDDPSVNWFTAKAQLDLHMGRFNLSPGYQYKLADGEGNSHHIPFLRVDYILKY